MSMASTTAERIDIEGKQAQRGFFHPQHSVPSGQHDPQHRAYHQRMIQHVRNNALDSLNCNPFHPVLSPSSHPSDRGLPEQGHTSGIELQNQPPFPRPDHRSDSGSTATSVSLPSPGSFAGTADLAQIGFGRYNSLPGSSSAGAANSGDQSVALEQLEPLLGTPVPFAMGTAQGYTNLIDTSAFPDLAGPLYKAGTHGSSFVFGDDAGKASHVDVTLGLGLDMQSNTNSFAFSAYDPMTYPYGVPNTGAFGYTGMYAPPPFAAQSGISNDGPSINPGYLHAPPPMTTTSSSHSSRHSMDDHEYGGRHDMMEFPTSPLHSISPSPSPIEAIPQRSGLRRSSDSVIPDNSASRGKRGHKRKMTWTSGMANEGPNVSQAQKEQELRELERLEAGGAATRRERRRLQNRLAQRAFRARSKLQNNAAATHLTDLEELTDVQAEQLHHMQEAMDKLQAENLHLRAQRWNQAKGIHTQARASRHSQSNLISEGDKTDTTAR